MSRSAVDVVFLNQDHDVSNEQDLVQWRASVRRQTSDEGDLTQYVARHLNQFLLDRSLRWQRTFSLDRLDALLLQVTANACLAHLSLRSAGLSADRELMRPANVQSLANSIGLTYETTRRRMIRLSSIGILLSENDGYVVRPALFIEGEGARLPTWDREALVTLLNTMDGQGFVVPRAALEIVESRSDDRIARAILDCSLRCLERFIGGYGGMVNGRIWAAILAANIRHLLNDGDRSLRFTGATLLPDEERRAISLRQLAREVDVPFETVRRQTAVMLEHGMIVSTTTGVIVPRHIVDSPSHRAGCAALFRYFRGLVDDVSRLATGDVPDVTTHGQA